MGRSGVTKTLLAIDLGGTKCDLAIFDTSDKEYQPHVRKGYSSGDYERLEDIISAFLEEVDEKPGFSSIGVAGVVSEGAAEVTNLPWKISEQALADTFGFQKVRLINDLTAVCASIPLLEKDDLLVIQQGDPQPGQLIGVVAPGTGLGEGLLVQGQNFFFPRGSEGGHTDFGPVNGEQTELLAWMLDRHAQVSYESLIAGPGVPNLYDFFRECKGVAETAKVQAEMEEAPDRTPIIFTNAFGENSCPLCRRVVNLFLDILGAEAGNLALKLYARGGIYIGGGIVPRIADNVSFKGFLQHFQAKGKMTHLMSTIPVRLIMNKDAALIGAARFGREMLVR